MLISALLSLVLVTSSVVCQKIVNTQYGQVKSHVVNVDNGRENTTVDVYFGIPYAADTAGVNRFRSPVPPDPWTDVFEANTISMSCPQNGMDNTTSSEDCLKLNIFAPTDTSQTYPVMIWIHGGAYWFGSAPSQGHFLASRGVILVTINYRLGTLGFAYTANDACPGNAGMWDQTAAIQFVADNIANFGGDPTKITIFGQSAGGASVSLHLFSPQSNHLFQQAIVHSGSEQGFYVVHDPDSNPEHHTYTMAEDLGCNGLPDDYAMMDCMRQIDWETVRDAEIGRCSPGYGCLGMAPVVDGPGGFMPQLPAQQRKDGEVMSGPIMAGICKEDGSLFSPILSPLIIFPDCCNRSYFERSIQKIVDFLDSRVSNATRQDTYEAVNWFYSPWPYINDNDLNRFKLVEMVTDVSFGMTWDKQVRDHSTIAPTYSYLFDYVSNRTSNPEWFGTTHSAELSFLFGDPLLIFNPEVRNDTNQEIYIPTNLDIDMSIFFQELWTNFAKFGNPSPSPVENPVNSGQYQWPQFTENDMNYIYMGNNDIETRKEYRQKEYAFWTYYGMGIYGEELGMSDYWNVYDPYDQIDEVIDPKELADAWLTHTDMLYM